MTQTIAKLKIKRPSLPVKAIRIKVAPRNKIVLKVLPRPK
jgi:hypothetical protein